MAETISSMLPLALMLAVTGAVFWWARRRARNAPPEQALRGPHGWLALFIFGSYFLAPLVTVGTLLNEFDAAERQYPNLKTIAPWQSYKTECWLLFGAVVAWQWWVAHRLHKKFVPGSVTHAKAFLLGGPVVLALGTATAAYSSLNYVATVEALTVLIKGFFWGLAWFLYFTFSRRVKNTYFTGVDGIRVSQRAHSPSESGERTDPKFSMAPAEPAAATPVPRPVPTVPTPAPPLREPSPARVAAVPEPRVENTAYSNTLTVQLDALKRMHERGAINDDEYARKRQELLARI